MALGSVSELIIEVVHICPDVRYWCGFCCTILTNMSHLVMLKFWLKTLEAKHDSGELCCPATALIVPLNCQSQQLSSALSSACDFKSVFANSVDTDQTASLGAV